MQLVQISALYIVALEAKKLIYLLTYGHGKLYRAAMPFWVSTRKPKFSDFETPFLILTKVMQLVQISAL